MRRRLLYQGGGGDPQAVGGLPLEGALSHAGSLLEGGGSGGFAAEGALSPNDPHRGALASTSSGNAGHYDIFQRAL